jgi:DNA-binding MarR family transcriptional regulator/N-acetylglutamate synthase-like GNAT family acetyltransferase
MIATDAVDRVRRFNRFYTRRLRLLEAGHLGSPFSLTEARILYEIAHRPDASAGAIAAALDLDAGYLSRTLRSFRRRGLVAAAAAPEDGRRRVLRLTGRGRRAFARLNARASGQVRDMLGDLTGRELEGLAGAMAWIETLLQDERPAADAAVELREPRPGDLGWVVERHGEIYTAEYGWSAEFERLVARVVGEFAAGDETARQRCWIATVDGRRAGCVFVMKGSDTVAKLRLLLVEPWARGHGLGGLLVRTCMAGGSELSYTRMTLWTNEVLHAARRIYEREGFVLVRRERHRLFGPELTGETWERDLEPPSAGSSTAPPAPRTISRSARAGSRM